MNFLDSKMKPMSLITDDKVQTAKASRIFSPPISSSCTPMYATYRRAYIQEAAHNHARVVG